MGKGVDSSTPFFVYFNSIKIKKMSKKVYGVVGCGWLGMPIAKEWISRSRVVHGTTSTESKLEKLEEENIIAHLLWGEESAQISSENVKWLKTIDVLLLNIPPSSLRESYGNLMLNIVKELNPKANIIFISSTSVYADTNQEVSEQTPLEGRGRNSKYIIEAEKMLKNYANQRLTIIRMSGLIGKGRNPAKFMNGREIGGGNVPVNLIHLEDCMGVINHIVDNEIWGESFNASAPIHPTKKEYYTQAANQLGIEPPKFIEDNKDYKIIDSSHLIEEYNYEFKYLDPLTFPLN